MAKQKAKQRVNIREMKSGSLNYSLYLDWTLNKKKFKEFLGLKVFRKPSTSFETQHNKETYAMAEIIRSQREVLYFAGELEDMTNNKKLKTADFKAYFENYVKEYKQKDKRVMLAVLGHFKTFVPEYVTAKEVTEELCLNFKKYLNDNLSGETPTSYFARFKKMLYHATKYGKLFTVNPAWDVKNKSSNESIKKDTLTAEELQLLANTPCGNDNVRRAFLFSCNTGCRWGEVEAIRWKDIKDGTLKVIQAKTKDKAKDGGLKTIKLNANAIKLIGDKPNDLEQKVFDLKSNTAMLKVLRNWTKKAGIDKHITFHCSRHTFGSLLAFYDNNVTTISNLLGHTTLKHTFKYVRVADEMKQKAVESLPNIEL